jgi:valyl-tRNA synthetase
MQDPQRSPYDPHVVEERSSQLWIRHALFRADPRSKKPHYCIVIPPPNVTGVLHMGHALVNTLQDILIRWKRMSGCEVLWVPGTDHAGIATQTVVEKQLIASEGRRRTDLSRDEFLARVWAWKEEHGEKILGQLQKMGCSCDFSRLAFTMDPTRNRAVSTMFAKMYRDGLIYQDYYLVNWDRITQTALADDEVEYEERESSLWTLRYSIVGEDQWIEVATTRPETLFGDVAIAVHPNDERYRAFAGKQVHLPLTSRTIPILSDPFVDPNFGTGAVKITPAHDHNDYTMAARHNLPAINILEIDGKMNAECGQFQGLTTEAARKAVVAALSRSGLLVNTTPYRHRVGLSYRSRAVIEPLLSKQWFVRITSFKAQLRKVVQEKKVCLIPSHWEATYFHWIDNLRDWCISRQLWWGHRIPIWYKKDDPQVMLCFTGEGAPPDPAYWYQDEDVLDTWFSSALWPFSTLGWPDETEELAAFYPNSTLITGHDILFFWVARMILVGQYALDKPPFPEVFLLGLIYGKSYWRQDHQGVLHYVAPEEKAAYDLGKPTPPGVCSKWEKMSKSKGNVIDPLEIIDSFGTDAMRMALTVSATQARQIDLDRRRFEEFKNFSNKIWNGARFIFMHIERLDPERVAEGLDHQLLAFEDRWILSLLSRTVQEMDAHLTQYTFDRAASQAYEFFWNQLCAYYLEITKPILFKLEEDNPEKVNKQKLLIIILCAIVRLLHPIAPFITEELFQELKKRFPIPPHHSQESYIQECLHALSSVACTVAPYPHSSTFSAIDHSIEDAFSSLDQIIHAVRNIRAELQIPPTSTTDLYLIGDFASPLGKLLKEQERVLRALVKCGAIHYGTEPPDAALTAATIALGLKIIVPLPHHLQEKELLRLTKDQEKVGRQEEQIRAQLANQEFLAKAPEALIQKLTKQLADLEAKLREITQRVAQLQQVL